MTSPYAVICPNHGQVLLTNDQYSYQLDHADDLWCCPHCLETSEFDSARYEAYYGDDTSDDSDEDVF